MPNIIVMPSVPSMPAPQALKRLREFAMLPEANWEKGLANPWGRSEVNENADAGRGQELKWEIPIQFKQTTFGGSYVKDVLRCFIRWCHPIFNRGVSNWLLRSAAVGIGELVERGGQRQRQPRHEQRDAVAQWCELCPGMVWTRVPFRRRQRLRPDS